MAQEMLSVKLCELDGRIAELHDRIQLSEGADRRQLEDEIRAVQQECRENEQVLRHRMKFSKAREVQQISEAYDRVEKIIRETQRAVCGALPEGEAGKMPAEAMLLLAEYVLDFAIQAAEDAVLFSMEAIHAQLEQQETEG
ncbi:MAG: hypothetical protein Q4C61_17500 [Lachnospiraceae bacterium]|nr:hypothetical protein [Lachnospiraceae bacterium]